MTVPAWREHAACLDHAEVFVRTLDRRGRPNRDGRPTERERQALAICATCTVRADCLADELAVMAQGVPSLGVFGGTTARQRQAMVPRVVVPIRHGTTAGYERHRNRPEVFGPPCRACIDAHAAYRRANT